MVVSQRLSDAASLVSHQIGTVRRIDVEPISSLAARRFAVACGEVDPVFFDDDAAAAAGWRGTPLPPLLLTSTRIWLAGPPTVELADDGTPLDDVGFPGGHGLRAMGGGQRIEWHADVVAGEPMTAESAVTGVNLKAGRSGELLLVELERRFVATDGAVLVSCGETRVLR